mmetsp:Transcript_12762/g.44742  ORF Transcript_12762/g.44742 Transcript_12762/m.44742 type:complete len:201 (-) Transcript_12762:1609-2211(-)
MVGNITEVMQSMRNDYPLLEKAIKEALQTLLQQRPADPVLFVAEKLREVNRENRIEMEMAATKIQALGRRKRDARRVKQLRHQSHLWLRDLFVKLDIESSNSISRQELIDFMQRGQTRDKLELPYRLTRRIPENVQGLSKNLLDKLQVLNKQFLSWEDFAMIFGLSKQEADAAREHVAVIRIQVNLIETACVTLGRTVVI